MPILIRPDDIDRPVQTDRRFLRILVCFICLTRVVSSCRLAVSCGELRFQHLTVAVLVHLCLQVSVCEIDGVVGFPPEMY